MSGNERVSKKPSSMKFTTLKILSSRKLGDLGV